MGVSLYQWFRNCVYALFCVFVLCRQVGDAQFALIQYASTVHVEFTLRALTSRQSVTGAIAALDFLPRDERLTTRTDLALLKTIHLMRVTVRL